MKQSSRISTTKNNINKKRKLNNQKWRALDTGASCEGVLSVEVLEDYDPMDLSVVSGLASKEETKPFEGADSVEPHDNNIGKSVQGDEALETNLIDVRDSGIFSDDPFQDETLIAEEPEKDPNSTKDSVSVSDRFVVNDNFPGWCCRLPISMQDFKPADIQKQVFSWYGKNKRHPSQVMIAAQTGSGKTLAFLLPLINSLNNIQSFSSAVILAPTRELVNQIFDVLSEITMQFKEWKVIKLQGGMSQEKQDRLLRNASESLKVVVVASPGRLGDLASQLPFMVLDDTDDLTAKIESMEPVHTRVLFKVFNYCRWLALDEYENLRGLDGIDHIGTSLRRIKLISSKNWSESFYISCSSATPNESNEAKLLEIIPFKPFLCNINIKRNPKISHHHIDCSTMVQKDLAVYYLHHTFTGKTAIFMNSLDGVRRLSALLRLLFPSKTVKTIRGDMKMSQRISVLEIFSSTKNCILVASDVAARGLDIVDTECVIHYDVPRNGDTYVHRSGRTARYDRIGIAITLCLPSELKKFNLMLKTLEIKQSKMIRMEPSICDHLRIRLELARCIEKEEHDKRLSNAQLKEEQEYEEALDIEVAKSTDCVSKAEIKRKKKQLKELLMINVDQINRKKGTMVVTPDMFKTYTQTKDCKSFLTLAKIN
eukprot:NODE_160_length_16633_cov_0.230132.p2 type:complete len:654 gc:universal NODE_160_length_16633_cov_0.230132:7686-5725(-)